MICRRTQDVDLASFLAEPRADEFAEFRAHYPVCADCAAEVRAWTELHLQLRDPEAHPEPRLLLAWQDEPASLAPERRSALARHLEACASCRDELRALRAFDPAAAAAAVAAPGDAVLERIGAIVRRILWQPALAYALVLLLLIPLVLDRWGEVEEPAPLSTEAPVLESKLEARRDQPRGLQSIAAREAAPKPAREKKEVAPPAEHLPSAPVPPAPVLAKSQPDDQPEQRQRLARRSASGFAAEEARPYAGALAGRGPAEAQPEPEPAAEMESRALAFDDMAAAESSRDIGRAAALAPAKPGLAWTREGDSLAVEIPVPPLRAGEYEIEVRVLHSDGRRELVERLSAQAESETATLRIPAAWLGSGPAVHAVEVTVPGDPPAARRVFTHALVVR